MSGSSPGYPSKGGREALSFKAQVVRGGDSDRETRFEFFARKMSSLIVGCKKLSDFPVQPVLGKVLFLRDCFNQPGLRFCRFDDGNDVFGGLTRAVDKGEHGTAVERELQYEAFDRGQLGEATQGGGQPGLGELLVRHG